MLVRVADSKPRSDPRLKQHRSFDGIELLRRSFRLNTTPQLPRQVDLRRWMSPIVSQDNMNTCVASAFASACEYIFKRRNGLYIPISRLFIYFNGQIIDQRTRSVEDAGASRRNVVVGMCKYGICKEELWPYDRRYLNRKPPQEVYDAAKQYTVSPLRIPLDVTAIKTCLANDIPALIAAKIKYEINGEANLNGGYISVPDPNDYEIANLTSHAVLLVGYDDSTGHFIARNSWGRDWGDSGYCYIPYNYLFDERLVNNPDYLWAITQITPRVNYIPTTRQFTASHIRYDLRYKRSRDKPRDKLRSNSFTTHPARQGI